MRSAASSRRNWGSIINVTDPPWTKVVDESVAMEMSVWLIDD